MQNYNSRMNGTDHKKITEVHKGDTCFLVPMKSIGVIHYCPYFLQKMFAAQISPKVGLLFTLTFGSFVHLFLPPSIPHPPKMFFYVSCVPLMYLTSCSFTIRTLLSWIKCLCSPVPPIPREVGAPLNRFKPSSRICLLNVPRRCFLWIIYVISVWFCYAFMHVCLLMPCTHLLGKG